MRYIWFSDSGMGKLSERTTQCKPWIAQLQTAAVHQKRTRYSDTDEHHFRIGSYCLCDSSDCDSRSSRAGARSLFSDPEDTTQSPSECSVAETIRLPLVRSESHLGYRKIRPRSPLRHNQTDGVDKAIQNSSDNGKAGRQVKLNI